MYISIVAVENNRVAKYAEFDTEPAAQAHCDVYGGFVYEGGYSPELYIAAGDVSLVPLKSQKQVLEEQMAAIDDQLKAIDLERLRTRGGREYDIAAAPIIALIRATLTPEQEVMLETIRDQLYDTSEEYRRIVDIETDTAANLRAQRAALKEQIKDLED